MFSKYDYTEELTELIKAGSDTCDLSHELADQAVPVYNADIVEEWSDNPDCWDRWADEMGENDGTIIEQMSRDLYLSYRDELDIYIIELSEEIEGENE